MILVAAVAAGLTAGCARARAGGRPFVTPQVRWPGLVAVAFVPQLLAFYLPQTRASTPDDQASVGLVISLFLLALFALRNLNQPGFALLGLGVTLNLMVILANGRLMPISPETVTRLVPGIQAETLTVGSRLGTGKDQVLPAAETRLEWLADRFLLPDWLYYRAAFSLGDVLIAAGGAGLFWAGGGPHRAKRME